VFASDDEVVMTIAAQFPFPKQHIEVLGTTMAYVDAGAGDPIVLLHGPRPRHTCGAT
jgi:hypothetical protein